MEYFIGNLSYDITEVDLRNVFQDFGRVASVTIPTDFFNGEPKGIAFITLEEKPRDALPAILNQVKVKGRLLNVEALTLNYVSDLLTHPEES